MLVLLALVSMCGCSSTGAMLDEMWLRQERVADGAMLTKYQAMFKAMSVVATQTPKQSAGQTLSGIGSKT